MNLENMEKDFPQMPEEMRLMVEREVKKQLTADEENLHAEDRVITEGESLKDNYVSKEQHDPENGYMAGEFQSSGEYRSAKESQGTGDVRSAGESQNSGDVRSAGERRSTGELHATGSRYAKASKRVMTGSRYVKASKRVMTGSRYADDSHHADGRSHRAAASYRNSAARRARKLTVLIAAAVALIGTTVFAGVNLSQRFFTEAEGTYGQKISIGFVETEDRTASEADISGESDANTESSESSDETYAITLSAALAGYEIPTEIPAYVTVEASYIPEGMVQYDDGWKMDYEDALWSGGGISMGLTIMDDTINDTPLLVKNVVYSEELTINGHYAVYLETMNSTGTGKKLIYVLLPEVWRVLTIYVGDDLSKEEALKVAEGLTITGTGESMTLDDDTYTWSDVANPVDDNYSQGEDILSAEVSAFEANLHAIGDTYMITASWDDEEGAWDHNDETVAVQVSDVQITDSLAILEDWETSSLVDDSWREAADENGTLLPVTIDYIKSGDGINTIDTVVKTEEVERKLVYATIEFTNTSDITLYDILFYVLLKDFIEYDGEIVEYDRILGDEAEWDKTSPDTYREMDYYDVQGGTNQNGSNYISCLKAGETVTIHFAWLVAEDELPYLYLNVNGIDGSTSIYEMEYVDIRQIG